MKRFFPLGLLSIALILPVSVLLACPSNAQELSQTKGGLSGAITDKSGAIVPGAKVTLTGASDSRVLTSDSAGRYEVIGLTPGVYTVTVEMAGFKEAKVKGVEVVINKVSSLNLALDIGQVSETVEVNANSVEVDTGSTAISSNLTATFYDSVPVARNVGSLFYTAPGVTNGGGSGTSNPSIGGSTGLENQYVADGVNITDGGYGGLGIWSPIYGSIGTGINLTFVQEVQVKTGAFEPKYGKGDGGIVQIVTKSGGTSYHGAISAFLAPNAFTGTQRRADDYGRVNVHGHISSSPQYDAAIEYGGYVPGAYLKDHLFFYGAYNPALNEVDWAVPTVSPLYSHGAFNNLNTINSWAGKLTYKLTDNTSVDASAFGDPARTNAGLGLASEDTFPFYPKLNIANQTGFSRWDLGTRSETVHISTSPSPTWQVDISASAKKAHFDETGLQNVSQIIDQTHVLQQGQFTAAGLGYTQNPVTHDYGFGIDTEKTVSLFGEQHTLSIGWGFTHSIYQDVKGYSGGRYTFPTTNSAGLPVASVSNNPNISGASVDAGFDFNLSNDAITGISSCPPTLCPYLTGPQLAYAEANYTLGHAPQVYLKQTRGLLSSAIAETSESYNALYANDNWAVNRHVTLNIGIRWDQELLNAITQSFTFVDNWSPRLGINFDPKGDRKSKIFFNYGRYTQSLPMDAALRDLSNEVDVTGANFAPQADANNDVILNSLGTATFVPDAAHLLSGNPAAGSIGTDIAISGGSSPVFIAPGAKLNFEEEFVGGYERQFRGFVLSARYTDRRLLRVLEDGSGTSPEGANGGGIAQNFVVGDYNSKTDYFVNEQEVAYGPTGTAPAGCPDDYGYQFTSLGVNVGGACGLNPTVAGDPTPDGKPDGFADPRRHYQAVELEANKNFSHNFLLRVNYRYAKLFGNYEGLFRNDNNQSDPSISSLFDFTQGVLGLLGEQFVRGYLNTDRAQVGNVFGSYVVPSGFARHFSAGIGLKGSSGTPISELSAHPVYQNNGEIPIGGRGSIGRTASNFQLDLKTDYPINFSDRYKLKLSFDAFNVTNSRSLTAVDQDIDLSYGNPNVDFLKPLAFQRAIYGRASVRFEF